MPRLSFAVFFMAQNALTFVLRSPHVKHCTPPIYHLDGSPWILNDRKGMQETVPHFNRSIIKSSLWKIRIFPESINRIFSIALVKLMKLHTKKQRINLQDLQVIKQQKGFFWRKSAAHNENRGARLLFPLAFSPRSINCVTSTSFILFHLVFLHAALNRTIHHLSLYWNTLILWKYTARTHSIHRTSISKRISFHPLRWM